MPGARLLHEGHYRDLERMLLDVALPLLERRSPVLLVTAGNAQARRLTRLLMEKTGRRVLAGVEVLSGIHLLPARLGRLPLVEERVSEADRSLLALSSMLELRPGEPLHPLRDNPGTALSLGSFFESLLEKGIDPGVYAIVLDMLEDGPARATGEVVLRCFERYCGERARVYRRTRERVMASEPAEGLSGTLLVYGFYDPNPAQRGYLARLCGMDRLDVHVFSPIRREDSHWSPLAGPLSSLAGRVGLSSMRGGAPSEMSQQARLVESLFRGGAVTPPREGFRLTAVSGLMGRARAVLDRVLELADAGCDISRVAVVRRSDEDMIVRMAHHEGVPVAEPLRAPLSELPAGLGLLAVLDVLESDFHHTALAALASSGLLAGRFDFSPSMVADSVLSSGIRRGRRDWAGWAAGARGPLAETVGLLARFAEEMPDRAAPAEHAGRLRELMRELSAGGLKAPFLDAPLSGRVFRSKAEVGPAGMYCALRLHLGRVTVTLRSGDPAGFTVTSPESLRGSLFEHVILLDLEEGTWPSMAREDPRLPRELLERLELSLPERRELEEAFLLRQAAECASAGLDIVWMERDSEGRELYPSPFISPLCERERLEKRPEWFVRRDGSAEREMLGGGHPGQLAMTADPASVPFAAEAATAERERLSGAPLGPHDGVLGPGHHDPSPLSATLLETYVRCPFRYLLDRVWKVGERPSLDVTTSAEPSERGRLVHGVVASLLEDFGTSPPRDAVETYLERAAERAGLARAMGSRALAGVFLDRQADAVLRSIGELDSSGLTVVATEETVAGTVAGEAFSGRVDLLMRDGEGRLLILDVKTGRSLPSERDVEEGRRYQPPVYYSLARQTFPDEELAGVGYVSVSGDSPGERVFMASGWLEDIMGATEERIVVLAGLIRQGFFPPCPSNDTCRFCSCDELCRLSPADRLEWKADADERLRLLRSVPG